jgi:hypothetical protein
MSVFQRIFTAGGLMRRKRRTWDYKSTQDWNKMAIAFYLETLRQSHFASWTWVRKRYQTGARVLSHLEVAFGLPLTPVLFSPPDSGGR